MLFIWLLFCLRIASPSSYKDKNKHGILKRPYDRPHLIDGINPDIFIKPLKSIKFYNGDFPLDHEEPRRLFQWIQKILHKNETKVNTSTTVKYPTYEEVINEKIRFQEIEKNLTVTLAKLSHVLNQILNIIKYARHQDFNDLHNFIPRKAHENNFDRQNNRFKRNINETGKYIKEKLQEKDNTEKGNTKVIRNEAAEDKENRTEKIDKDGRRTIIPMKTFVTNDEVKNRLFKYIDEAFLEVAKKIESLRETKEMFSKDISFRIGYIISNIDTLDINMKNLKRDMDKNRFIWDDRKILNLYDTVKVSNRAVSDLLETLKLYIEKSSI